MTILSITATHSTAANIGYDYADSCGAIIQLIFGDCVLVICGHCHANLQAVGEFFEYFEIPLSDTYVWILLLVLSAAR